MERILLVLFCVRHLKEEPLSVIICAAVICFE